MNVSKIKNKKPHKRSNSVSPSLLVYPPLCDVLHTNKTIRYMRHVSLIVYLDGGVIAPLKKDHSLAPFFSE